SLFSNKAGGVVGLGWSVSMDPSGEFAISGTPYVSVYRGAATIFQRSEGSWIGIPPVTISASDGGNQDYFGHSTAIERCGLFLSCNEFLSSHSHRSGFAVVGASQKERSIPVRASGQ